MKRTRAQQPKVQEPQDVAAANANPKPQHRAKQPRQQKGAAKKPTAAARGAAVAAAAAAANAAAVAASPRGAGTAPTVSDVCSTGEGEAEADAQTVEWDLDGGISNGSWWTWGVEEEKLLGWFPFVEEDFRCLGGRGGDAEVAFDDDIWRIHQIYEIPNYAAK
uniref:Uncharacterized protein n=1 Tax=Arundo donax TaxID=35708 RepID=A0A0A8Z260_ARUDO